MYVCVSIVVFYLGLSSILLCSTPARQLDPDLQVFFFFFFCKKRKKEFFSDSSSPPSYPPTDTILFRTRDNFIHLHIIVSNSIGKLLPTRLRAGQDSYVFIPQLPPTPGTSAMRFFTTALFRHEMNTVSKNNFQQVFYYSVGSPQIYFPANSSTGWNIRLPDCDS